MQKIPKLLQIVFFVLIIITVCVSLNRTTFASSLLSDSFTGTTIDTDKWTEVDPGGLGGTIGDVQQNGTVTVANSYSGGNWGQTALVSNDSFSATGLSISAVMSRTSDTVLGYGDYDFGTPGKVGYMIDLSGSGILALAWNGGALDINSSCGAVTNGDTYKIAIISGGFEVYDNGTLKCTLMTATVVDNKPVFFESGGAANSFDDILVTGPAAPAAITDLAVDALDSSASLTWTAPANNGAAITDYSLQYRIQGAGSYTTFDDGVSTATNGTITGLTNGEIYEFNVQAVNAQGTSTESNTPTATPITPTFGTIMTDDFTGTTIDPLKWLEIDSGGLGGATGDVQQNGSLTINNSYISGWGHAVLYSASTFPSNGLEVSAVMTRGGDQLLGYGDVDFGSLGKKAYVIDVQSSNVLALAWDNGGLVDNSVCTTTTSGATYKLKVVSGGFEVYKNGALACTLNTAIAFSNKPVWLQSDTPTSTYDDVLVYGIVDVPNPPTVVVASPASDQVYVQWKPVTGATGYSIQYKLTSSGSWTTATSTGPAKLITGLTNGLSYDFKIASVSGAGTGPDSSVYTATPVVQTTDQFYNQLLITGQSLSTGANGDPNLTLVQPYSNKMLNVGGTAFLGLVEPLTGAEALNVETIGSAMANLLTSLSGALSFRSVVSLHGVASLNYVQLKKGTTPYDNGMAQIANARNISLNLGIPFKVRGVVTLHGESDHIGNTSGATYAADLVEWQNDYDTDAKALTGQTDDIPLFTDQMSAATTYNSATSAIPIAQLSAADDNPNKIVLVGPKYFLDYYGGPTNGHLKNYAYRRLGEYYGKVMNQVLVNGTPWVPLEPSSIIGGGNTIIATFNVPVPPLVLDTTLVDLKANYGFEFTDSTDSATITGVAVTAPNQVTITLSNTPTGTSPKLRYAYTGTAGADPGARSSGSARGNLRDSDTTTAFYTSGIPASTIGNTLYNWSVIFDKPITLDVTAPVISQVTPVPTPARDTTPDYTFTTNEAGTITYGGSCSATTTAATVGSNTITFNSLTRGTYTNCTVRVTDIFSNASNILAVSSFTINTGSGFRGGVASGPVIPVEWNITLPSDTLPLPTVKPTVPVIPAATTTFIATPVTSVTPIFYFTKDLRYGMTDPDVKLLQQYLNSHGYVIALTGPGSRGNESMYFGWFTQKAVIQFQKVNGITPTNGNFGPKTRAKLMQLLTSGN